MKATIDWTGNASFKATRCPPCLPAFTCISWSPAKTSKRTWSSGPSACRQKNIAHLPSCWKRRALRSVTPMRCMRQNSRPDKALRHHPWARFRGSNAAEITDAKMSLQILFNVTCGVHNTHPLRRSAQKVNNPVSSRWRPRQSAAMQLCSHSSPRSGGAEHGIKTPAAWF